MERVVFTVVVVPRADAEEPGPGIVVPGAGVAVPGAGVEVPGARVLLVIEVMLGPVVVTGGAEDPVSVVLWVAGRVV